MSSFGYFLTFKWQFSGGPALCLPDVSVAGLYAARPSRQTADRGDKSGRLTLCLAGCPPGREGSEDDGNIGEYVCEADTGMAIDS